MYDNAADHPDRVRRYPSDMTDAEWAAVRPLLPVPAWLNGRGGRPEGYCHRQLLDAVRYDEGRMRDISVAVSPSHADAILAAQESGTTDIYLHKLVAEAIADAYFRQGGGRCADVEVQFKDVEWLNISF
ncbi:transposase [Streptomyces sp. NPDC001843]|uniref:transposase n=1 Tax=Streptomyces sp. NPDC001843 TaxID=3364617 RepID=UPI0036C260AF